MLLHHKMQGAGGPALLDPRHPEMPLHQVPQQVRGEQPAQEGAVGGDREGFALEQALNQLSQSLRGLLDQLRTAIDTAGQEQGERDSDEHYVADSDSDDIF